MAALSHLRREEKLGLGIAVAVHIALVAALVIEARREVPVIPPAERMTVSLSDNVSMESTAPNPSQDAQAAVAPVLAPESEPLPAPVTEPVQPRTQTVIEQPVARPKPASKPAPKTPSKPQTKPAPPSKPSPKSGGGSRIGDDFLKGLSSGDKAAAGTPAATFGAAEAASLRQAIARQIKPHWSAPEGVDVEKLVTVVRFRLDKDGSLIGNPTIVSQSGVTPSNEAQKGRHAEQAIRAIRLAAPFDLPAQFYDQWKVVNSQFDRRLSQ
jgi:outer membrane biosynthesis protein TonB